MRELARILFCETALGWKPSTDWVIAVVVAFLLVWVWALIGRVVKFVAELLSAPTDDNVGFCSLQVL